MTDERIICPACAEAGLTSTINVTGPPRVTLMGYSPTYDEAGVRHLHDRNRITTDMACSNGHVLERFSYRSCPSCKWTRAAASIKVVGTIDKAPKESLLTVPHRTE
jgi:hypothetical protein